MAEHFTAEEVGDLLGSAPAARSLDDEAVRVRISVELPAALIADPTQRYVVIESWVMSATSLRFLPDVMDRRLGVLAGAVAKEVRALLDT